MKSIINWYITSDSKLKGDIFKLGVFEFMDNIRPLSVRKIHNGYIAEIKISSKRDDGLANEDIVATNEDFLILLDNMEKWHTKNIKNYTARIESFFSKYSK
jgi:hypothetical protein